MSSQKYTMNGVELSTANSAKQQTSCLSSKARCVLFIVLTVIFICVIAVLAIALAYRTQKYNELTDKYSSESGKSGKKAPNVCLTHTCLETANRINQFMDPEAAPCDNFYQYACGGWEKKYSIPYYSPYSWSVVEEMDRDVLKFFRDELEKPAYTTSFAPEVKARKLYATCMNTLSLETVGLSEVRKIIDGMGGMSFNITEPYPEFNLTERLLELREMKISPLYKLALDFHRFKPNTLLLSIAPPDSPLIVSRKESLFVWQLFAEDWLNMWNDMYKNETPPAGPVFLETYYIMNDIKETLDNDIVSKYSPEWNDTLMSIDELQKLCPQIDWKAVIGRALAQTDNPLPEQISVSNKAYILALSLLLDRWNTRALDNFLKFSLPQTYVAYFDFKYRMKQDNLLHKFVFGRTYWFPEPRWSFCVKEMKKSLALVLAKWYVDGYIQHEDKVVDDVDEMIELIRTKYIEVLRNTDLMDAETKDYAIRKLKAIDKQVAFSEDYDNRTVLKTVYDHVVANDSNSFFMNLVETARGAPYMDFAVVGTLPDHLWDELWMDYAFVVNGYYSSNFNRFTILAGILHGEFYNLNNPKYMNYGIMGFTIGHEFTHGFDDTGRHFGLDGLLNSWWTNTSEINYSRAKKCYAEQYSTLKMTAYGHNDTYLNDGNATLDENIADNGAEYVVFQAYEDWIKIHGKEQLLPTPYLDTWQKQYYIALAQGWCAKFTPTGLGTFGATFVHSQKEARVNGMLQNSVRFSDIFQCPSGSFMNPEDKCKLW